MTNSRWVAVLLLVGAGALSCAAGELPATPGTGGNTAPPGSGGATGSDGSTLGGGGGTSGFSTFFGSGGAGGSTAPGSGGGNVTPDAGPRDSNATEAPSRMCLPALGDAPAGNYDWKTCCPNEAATAQDWCTHYAAFCKFNYPVMSNLSPGAVPLKDMADCLARYPPLTVKSRACRSNFLCEDSNLGQPNPKTCDFPDLNRRKCDGL